MSDQVPKIAELAEIQKQLNELKETIDTIRDEILESIEDTQKQLNAKLLEIGAFQQNVLEPNQQKIWNDGIGTILKTLKEVEKVLNIEPDEQ